MVTKISVIQNSGLVVDMLWARYGLMELKKYIIGKFTFSKKRFFHNVFVKSFHSLGNSWNSKSEFLSKDQNQGLKKHNVWQIFNERIDDLCNTLAFSIGKIDHAQCASTWIWTQIFKGGVISEGILELVLDSNDKIHHWVLMCGDLSE